MKILCYLAIIFMSSQSYAVMMFEQAMEYYSSEKYERAYEGFYDLAKIGNRRSQFNIGVMHLKGQFLAKDYAKAFAWIALSDKGVNAKEKTLKIIDGLLTAPQRLEAKSLLKNLIQMYGQTVIETNYIPSQDVILSNQFIPAKTIEKVIPRYPKKAIETSKQGWVDMYFSVDKYGITRYHFIYNSSSKLFEKAALTAIKQWKYKPATVNGKAVDQYGFKMRFLFEMAGLGESGWSAKKTQTLLDESKQNAEIGGAREKYEYAYKLDIISSLPGLLTGETPKVKGHSYATPWYAKAAIDGSASAAYQLGRNSHYGNQCGIDDSKSLFWLDRATQGGIPDAQLLLGVELLSGVRYTTDRTKGLALLKEAASKNHTGAMLKFAWISATSPDENIFNPKLAQETLAKLNPKELLDSLSFYETKAATAAANSDYSQAIKWQKKTVKQAKKQNLNLELFETHLNTFKQKQRLFVEI